MELDDKNFRKMIVIITYTIILFAVVMNLSVVLGSVLWIFKLFLPFIIGFSLAFMINVIMSPIENQLKRLSKEIEFINERVVALLISIGLIVSVIFFLLFLIVPEFKNTIQIVSNRAPNFIKNFELWRVNYTNRIPFEIPDLQINWNNITEWVQSFIGKGSSALFTTTVNISSSIVNVIFNVIIGIVFSIYLLMQKKKLNKQLKAVLFRFLPEKNVNRILEIGNQSNEIFSSFIQGQFLEALIIGTLSFIGMLVLNLPYPLVISALVGFTAIIPVFGALIGTSVGVFLILMVSPIKALWFIIFILVLQQIEGNIIYPKVVGKSIGLPSIWVFSAVIIGGSAFGVLGMLIGVPLSSLLYSLLREKVYNQ